MNSFTFTSLHVYMRVDVYMFTLLKSSLNSICVDVYIHVVIVEVVTEFNMCRCVHVIIVTYGMRT